MENQKPLIDNNQINIFELFATLWKGKYIIILFIIISGSIGVYYNSKIPNIYELSFEVRPGKDSEYAKFLPINMFFNYYSSQNSNVNTDPYNLKSSSSNKQLEDLIKSSIVNKNKVFENFYDEIMDYEELKLALKKNIYAL